MNTLHYYDALAYEMDEGWLAVCSPSIRGAVNVTPHRCLVDCTGCLKIMTGLTE